MRQLLTTLLIIGLGVATASAQGWDSGADSWDNSGDDSWGTDDNSGDTWGNDNDDNSTTDQSYDYDAASSGSGAYDSTGGADDGWDDWDGGGDWGAGGGFGDVDAPRNTRPAVVARPYERFTGMPYDSATELITFVEVVEVIIPDAFFDLPGSFEYDTEDSLQARAMKWLEKEFGKKQTKKMIEDAGMDKQGREGNTINALVEMPLIYEKNKYSKSDEGLIEFDMELRFKQGRYRYKFQNFVHKTIAIAGKRGAREDRTYLEYYMTAKRDARHNDEILMACNTQMNHLIEGLKESCAHVPFLDDDESW